MRINMKCDMCGKPIEINGTAMMCWTFCGYDNMADRPMIVHKPIGEFDCLDRYEREEVYSFRWDPGARQILHTQELEAAVKKNIEYQWYDGGNEYRNVKKRLEMAFSAKERHENLH